MIYNFFSQAKEQKGASKKDLANALMSPSSISLKDLFSNTWKIESSSATLACKATTQMEVVRKCATEDCVKGCNGGMPALCRTSLNPEQVHPLVYALVLRELLVKCHGKNKNIMIAGHVNCAKTSLFKPLQTMFKAFSNN